jgi:membrane-associated phospholipid phosphatase
MRPTAIVLIAAAFPGVSDSGWAQTPMSDDSAHAAKTLFTYRDPLLAAGYAGVTVAMFPLDKSVARRLRNPTVQANRFFENASTDLRIMADPGGVIIGISMYGVGRLARWRNVADFGLHVTEAISVAGLTTVILRGVAGRSRPFVVRDSNPNAFQFGRGFDNHDFQSFPSGHATSAFALASTVTSESQRWWPHHTWIVAPLMYGAAALSGFGRMYNDRHWASDIVSGAAIGTFAGIKVVRYNHGRPSNKIDRFFLGSMVAAGSHGDVKTGFAFPY